jgi:drug/metabolite transporter (DMT)-like permease
MRRFRNPLRVNGILLGILFFLVLIGSGATNLRDAPFILGTVMLLLAPVNLVVGMVRNRNRRDDGMAFIITAGLLLLLGFSTCSAGLAYGNINFH